MITGKLSSCLYKNLVMNCTSCQLITGWLPNLQDPIMVCETWWTDQSVTNIKGLNLFRTDREHSRGGGV
jgi:hypothetical protein